MRLVVDTNVLISALIRQGETRRILFDFGFEFVTPAYSISEIRKYKDEICRKAGIDSVEFEHLLEILFRYIKIINPDFYSSYLEEAGGLIKDSKDVSFLACALALQCGIWSNDKGFKEQDKIKIYSTQELFNEFGN
jgi:predicted nucleic acid-binding protein